MYRPRLPFAVCIAWVTLVGCHARQLTSAEPAPPDLEATATGPLRGCKPADKTNKLQSSADGCKLLLSCGRTLLDVGCDGENDGTGTSLCTCYKDGERAAIAGLWDGEGKATCKRAAEACLATPSRPSQPNTNPKPATTPQQTGSEHSQTCPHERQVEESLEPVDCSSSCQSQRILSRRCEGGYWQTQPALEPMCSCRPHEVPQPLRACDVSRVVLTPTLSSPSDGCNVKFQCPTLDLEVTCDGEDDGTGTSLCDCMSRGQAVNMGVSAWKGEGIDTCYQAATRCVERASHPPASHESERVPNK